MGSKIKTFILLYLFVLSSGVKATISELAIDGLIGESVRLPCEVDKASCGQFHSIKWYKGNERVFVFSEIAGKRRSEGSLLARSKMIYTQDEDKSWLQILPLRTEDEGRYKCELTYITVNESCKVVQFVDLTTLSRPTSYSLTVSDGTPVESGTKIGPLLEGDHLSLRCEAGGAKPLPSVKWFNGTKNMQGRFQSSFDPDGLYIGSHPIEISLTRYDLRANFSCKIFNEAMKEPLVLWVEIDIDVSPSSVEITTPTKSVKEGEIVSILCIVKGAKPQAQITWTNNSVPITDVRTKDNLEKNTGVIPMSDGTLRTESRLEFMATRFDNGLTFGCEAENEVLKKNGLKPIVKSVVLDVQYAPSVIVSPAKLVINESMDFNINCQYIANPLELTHVRWILNDQLLSVENNREKYEFGDVHHPSLFVRNASAEDMGNYTCMITNEVGTSSPTNGSYIIVQYAPQVAVEMKPEGPISEEDYLNVTLICDIVSAYPKTLTRVRWFLDGVLLKDALNETFVSYEYELPECDGNETLYDDDSEFCKVDPSRLLLEKVSRQFHGNYSCEGMNSAGWGPRSNIAPLVVNYPPGIAQVSYDPIMVIKGEPVNFTCNVNDTGRPEATSFKWTRNSVELNDVTSKVWHVDSASIEIDANITCLPYNSEGEGIPSSVSVNVYAAPFFITRLPPYYGALINAEEISLECRVECSPMCSVQWHKDNIPLYNNTHYHIENVQLPPNSDTRDLQSVMSILWWKMSEWPDRKLHREFDNANYTCIATENEAGPSVSSLTIFRVEYPPKEINISYSSIEVIEGSVPTGIQCSAFSYPEPSYIWKHQDEVVSTDSVLALDVVERDNSGEYTCIAENKHGFVKNTTFLDVLFKPECEIVRQDWKDGEMAKIRLICRAYANPDDVSFRWRLRNETLTDDIDSSGLSSTLNLDAISESLGTYYCYVNNSVGESIPCEIDVTGVAGLIETLGDDNILIYAVIGAAILLAIIILILIVIFCRRQRQRGKYSDANKKGTEAPPSSTVGGHPNKDKSNGRTENPPSSPDAEEGPTFYENLPFHGIQAPPNKPLLTGNDLDYADVDSTTYAYGPIPYKAESVSAALEKKAEKEFERTGIPMRPPRKK